MGGGYTNTYLIVGWEIDGIDDTEEESRLRELVDELHASGEHKGFVFETAWTSYNGERVDDEASLRAHFLSLRAHSGTGHHRSFENIARKHGECLAADARAHELARAIGVELGKLSVIPVDSY